MQNDLQAIRDLVTDAALPPKVEQGVLGRLDDLPNLYAALLRTYESRFSDRVVEAVERIVRILSAPDAGPDGPPLAVVIVNRMRAMHDQHGIAVAIKPPPVVKPARRKVSRKA